MHITKEVLAMPPLPLYPTSLPNLLVTPLVTKLRRVPSSQILLYDPPGYEVKIYSKIHSFNVHPLVIDNDYGQIQLRLRLSE